MNKIQVLENNGYRYIATGNGNLAQGVIDTNNPDRILSPFVEKCIEEVNSLPDGSSVLLLGGGTFSIPKHAKESIHMRIVELNPEMVEVAKEYFGYQEKLTHFIDIGDAEQLVKHYINLEERFDLVIVDLFGESEVPEFARQHEFYSNLSWLTKNIIVNEISCSYDIPHFDYFDLEDMTIETTLIPSNVYWAFTKISLQ